MNWSPGDAVARMNAIMHIRICILKRNPEVYSAYSANGTDIILVA